MKYFQWSSASVANHKKQILLRHANDRTTYLQTTFKQTLNRILRNTATLNTMRVDLHESYQFFHNIFLKFGSKLKLCHYIASNTSDPNCTKQTLYAFIIFLRHDSLRLPHSLKKKIVYWNNWPKILLTRNYQITIISLPLPSFPLQLEAFLLPSLACREDQRPT